MKRAVFKVIAGIAFIVLSNGRKAGAQTLQARLLPAKPVQVIRAVPESDLWVKFRDDLKVRTADGGLTAGANLGAVQSVQQTFGLSFERSTRLSQESLDAMETQAAQMSGRAQPDLGGSAIVTGPAATLQDAANALLALEEVEWVEFVARNNLPPQACSDIAPPTPHYFAQGYQRYHGANPGLNVNCAWTYGGRGQGVRIADVEYAYRPAHEDRCTVNGPALTCVRNTPENDGVSEGHGTAVLGILGALDNAYGCTGLVPEADVWFFSEVRQETWPYCVQDAASREDAIDAAIDPLRTDPLRAGDVLLLEMQLVLVPMPGFHYGAPAEVAASVFQRTQNATDRHIIVVAAAGNYGYNLDIDNDPGGLLSAWRQRNAERQSGAIIVGAGTSDALHNKVTSCFGLRVDVQGWGENVFTLGGTATRDFDGWAYPADDDGKQSYTGRFAGTSSGSAMVAGAVVALQSLRLAAHPDDPLWAPSPTTPPEKDMRNLLMETGWAQGSGGHIGRFPNIAEAMLDSRMDIGAVRNSNGVPGGCTSLPTVVPTTDPASVGPASGWRTRFLSLSVPAQGSTAIRVEMIDLQNPQPANAPCRPPPDFSTWESATCTAPGETNGCARWVGKPGTFYETQGPPLAGPYRAARLQCTPYYHDWGTEGLFHVAGAEIVPSSTYGVQVFSASCSGIEATCADVSAPVRFTTRRSGDVTASYNPPATTSQPDGIDVTEVLNKFKNVTGAPVKARSQVQPNLVELNGDINGLDIVAVVAAVEGFAYPYGGPCPCPSLVTCGPATGSLACPSGVGTCLGSTLPGLGLGAMCVKTCSGSGDPCINSDHCPTGETCGNPYCRDKCGRCN
jgi:hypothetical protein